MGKLEIEEWIGLFPANIGNHGFSIVKSERLLHIFIYYVDRVREMEFLRWKKKRKKKREVNKRYKLNCNLNINM